MRRHSPVTISASREAKERHCLGAAIRNFRVVDFLFLFSCLALTVTVLLYASQLNYIPSRDPPSLALSDSTYLHQAVTTRQPYAHSSISWVSLCMLTHSLFNSYCTMGIPEVAFTIQFLDLGGDKSRPCI